MKYLLIFLIVLAFFVLSVTLGAHNDQLVSFNYLIAKGEYCLSTLLATLFASGFLLCWIICGLFYLRVHLRLSRAERKIRLLEQKPKPIAPGEEKNSLRSKK
ncbi:LapA family protein [Candidatus Profftia tarda]|uniref:Lipopolysaccharide assembly protein A n=1 Tax=Candidatus Profftia tarda TaxID=1177216 RepID=A0A8E4GHN8_9ENTR|nr:LapA family protein [Candidatus Profftia tarda]CAD6507651.1 Inner membrane protein YciS [Candidatus Profftia tarda]